MSTRLVFFLFWNLLFCKISDLTWMKSYYYLYFCISVGIHSMGISGLLVIDKDEYLLWWLDDDIGLLGIVYANLFSILNLTPISSSNWLILLIYSSIFFYNLRIILSLADICVVKYLIICLTINYIYFLIFKHWSFILNVYKHFLSYFSYLDIIQYCSDSVLFFWVEGWLACSLIILICGGSIF